MKRRRPILVWLFFLATLYLAANFTVAHVRGYLTTWRGHHIPLREPASFKIARAALMAIYLIGAIQLFRLRASALQWLIFALIAQIWMMAADVVKSLDSPNLLFIRNVALSSVAFSGVWVYYAYYLKRRGELTGGAEKVASGNLG